MPGIPRHTPIHSDRQHRSPLFQGITFEPKSRPKAPIRKKNRDSLRVPTLYYGIKAPKGGFMEETKNATRVGLYIDSNLLTRCDAAVPLTNTRSRSEFICDAIEHYIAVLTAKGSSKVITPALESVIGGKIAGTEDRISRMIFKLAVEIALMNHLTAGRYRYDDQYLDQLRDYCVQEVATLNGRMNLADIAKEYER